LNFIKQWLGAAWRIEVWRPKLGISQILGGRAVELKNWHSCWHESRFSAFSGPSPLQDIQTRVLWGNFLDFRAFRQALCCHISSFVFISFWSTSRLPPSSYFGAVCSFSLLSTWCAR
jgi:hypothetical protein